MAVGQTNGKSDALTTTSTFARFQSGAADLEVTRAANEKIDVYALVDFVANPSTNVIVRAVTTPNVDANPNFENAQTMEVLIDNATDPAFVFCFSIMHGQKVRFEAKEDGTTQGHTATLYWSKDTMN